MIAFRLSSLLKNVASSTINSYYCVVSKYKLLHEFDMLQRQMLSCRMGGVACRGMNRKD